ncbi:hypothetical protein HDU78_004357 [Chytriomyces hyalinus]|nr:hypothetical protein HDU78_004357 [Chytriomyces hyalinus]KAJ3266187.1 hypothetical protein HDU77_002318 [Chytriomyces hyalinus]KAJ3409781.1 hypothetical protein HDU80_009758 [Chytriomyces hyalinus]
MTGSDVHHFHRDQVVSHTNKLHPTLRTVLIAVDASKYAHHAFTWTLQNLCKPTDLVYVVNVHTIPLHGHLLADAAHKAHLDAVEAELEAESHALVKKYCEVIRKEAPEMQFVGLSLRGHVGQELLDRAEEVKCEVLVCGTRGLTALGRAAMGSTSEFLVHYASMAVVVPKMTEA